MIKVGISIGDPNGIGPEITLKALRDNRLLARFIAVVYASTSVLKHYKKLIPEYNANYTKVSSVNSAKPKQIPQSHAR